MYQISVDKYILYDTRDEELIVANPKCNLETNTVGEASFTIYSNHPQYAEMQKLKSLFKITQGSEIIFRGRMTRDSKDFYNAKAVDLEGAMAFLNDSVIRPFNFPEDFLENQDYNTASTSGNVIEFFLGWLLSEHNQQTEEFQHLKLGNVTVADPNNYLARSNTEYASTWETVRTKLFGSALGGYLCPRYEEDGTYIDYLAEFELTNTQHIEFGGNLLDVKHDSDANSTYTAMLPLGATIEGEGRRLDITSLADGEITDDLVKQGDIIYSKSAKEQYGFILAPLSESTWDDVTDASNLRTKAISLLSGTAMKLIDTVETKAVDMHFTDKEIASFRINRKVVVDSAPHNLSATYNLTRLEIDIANPQNTIIVAGETERTLIDKNYDKFQNADQKIESTKNELKVYVSNATSGMDDDLDEIRTSITEQHTELINTCDTIIMEALKSYTETSNFEEFKQTIEAQLQILADNITLQFNSTMSEIDKANGAITELQQFNSTYFTFDINGFTIGKADNPNKVVLANDMITIQVNGVIVQSFDANGRSLIPELKITKSFDEFGFVTDQDNLGNVNCRYVGEQGVNEWRRI